MEACFFSSNSFTKTTEVLPSVRARIPTYKRKRLNQYQSKTLTAPNLSVSCCQSQSGSTAASPQDEENPFVSSDWRAFRAKLVANESQSIRPEHQSANQTAPASPPPPIPFGSKWAHTIPEPEKGCLLIATEKLDGVHIFERTVILLLSTGPIGPTGLILNRPSLMSIKEMKSSSFDVSGTFSDRPLFFGGPLEEGLFLVSPEEEGKTEIVEKSGVFEEVMKGLYYGTKESVGCAVEMVKRDMVKVGEFRFFDGYCGWDKEQLRDEIRAGYWTVAACSCGVVGLTSVGSIGLWEEIIGLMGRRKVS
ncbi:uncharacterized protein [Primulina huaijiensis]|uniref:uncharacterized protein isoform X1 n=1 Tax=Primulina huaijiensis TaxID=1492673 RepID=UPI003CC79929